MPDTAPATVGSRITGVTVYRGWARVERTAELPADAAARARVRLGDLPLALDDASVQVRVEAADGGGAVPVATDLRVGLAAPPPPAEPPPDARDALIAAQRAEQAVAERLAHVQNERQQLEGLELEDRPDGPEGSPPPPSPLAARRAWLAWHAVQVDTRVAEERALNNELRAARIERQRCEAALRAASSAGQLRPHELRKHVEVGLGVVGTGTPAAARVVVSYLVPGVRWAPTYRLQFDGAMSRVRVALRAAVTQRTGEDWTDVALTVSTADVQRWTELPELSSVRIGRRQAPPAAVGWREPPVGADELFRDHDAAFGGPAAPPAPVLPEPAPEPPWDGATEYAPELAEDEGEYDDDLRMADMAPAEAVASERRRDEMDMLGGMVAGQAMPAASMSAPPPAPKSAPMKKAKSGKAEMAKRRAPAPDTVRAAFGGRGSGAGGEDWDDEAQGGPLTAAEALLDYGALRMGDPAHTDRGHLRPLDRGGRYAEQLHAAHRAQIATLLQALQRAVDEARSATQRSLPPGCSESAPPDGFDHAITAEAPVSLPSDGQFHTIPLATHEGPVSQRYVVVPRESTDVFRFVEWANPLPGPLLAGPADVVVGGDYLVTVPLATVAKGGMARLGLGVEQGIRVARNTRYEEDTTGMLGGTLNLHHTISVEVRNDLDRAVTVEVRERLPVTDDEEDDITVTEGAVTPPWEAWEPTDYHLRGGRRWVAEVEPGGVVNCSAAYTVVISSKDELVGGNRREQ